MKNTSSHICSHNCIEELTSDHKKILEELDKLGKEIEGLIIDKNKIEEFLHFTEAFAEPHHQKEEQVLFPALERKGMPKEGGPIGMMLFDHKTKRGYIKKLQKALKENNERKIKENAQAIISLLGEHIYKENNVLYPCAKEILTQDELNALAQECKKIKN